VRNAANILVLDKGEVLEYGPHDRLLEIENGKYRELYEKQFLQASVLS
jgi:ATP-binding cassette subfamily B protein